MICIYPLIGAMSFCVALWVGFGLGYALVLLAVMLFVFPVCQSVVFLSYVWSAKSHLLLFENKTVLIGVREDGRGWKIGELGARVGSGRGAGSVFVAMKEAVDGTLCAYWKREGIVVSADAANNYLAMKYAELGFVEVGRGMFGVVKVVRCPEMGGCCSSKQSVATK